MIEESAIDLTYRQSSTCYVTSSRAFNTKETRFGLDWELDCFQCFFWGSYFLSALQHELHRRAVPTSPFLGIQTIEFLFVIFLSFSSLLRYRILVEEGMG